MRFGARLSCAGRVDTPRGAGYCLRQYAGAPGYCLRQYAGFLGCEQAASQSHSRAGGRLPPPYAQKKRGCLVSLNASAGRKKSGD